VADRLYFIVDTCVKSRENTEHRAYAKCMFNVHKNQQSRQTGSWNLMGPKTLPTIWDTYMKLVTKYQISAINSYWEKCDEKYLGWMDGQTDRGKTYNPDGRNLIFGHKLQIGTPYSGKRFWTHQIPTSCLSTLLIFMHIEHICSFFVAFFSATIELTKESRVYIKRKCRHSIFLERVNC
jgi:hypothetical protein